jgi:thiamine-monophosphate kinase
VTGVALGEFALIDRYFRDRGAQRADVRLGVGDDGALLRLPPGEDLVAVSDTLVDGVHFPSGSDPRSVGHRALAVNLSDIAAMGGTPRWALLSLTLPSVDEAWLEAFAAGFGDLALGHGVALVGGDTTRGPLTIGVQVLGSVPAGQGLRRSGARAGDALFVSGTPGDAAAGLASLMGRSEGTDHRTGNGRRTGTDAPTDAAAFEARFLFPTPRVALGQALLPLASACIDVSDGLVGDLGKLAAASGCAAVLDVDALPSTAPRHCVLHGGDDYELLFTVPPARVAAVAALPGVTRIGEMRAGEGVSLRESGRETAAASVAGPAGYDHFAR